MSIFKKFGRALERVAKPLVRTAAAAYTGGQSEVLWRAYEGVKAPRSIGNSSAARSITQVPFQSPSSWDNLPWAAMPGGTPLNQNVMGSVMRLPQGAGGAVRAFGRVITQSTIVRSANTYCRRHPAWCAALPGGIAAVVDLVSSGSLPPIKRRRARGINASELRAFRRVTGVLNKYAKTPPVKQTTRRKC